MSPGLNANEESDVSVSSAASFNCCLVIITSDSDLVPVLSTAGAFTVLIKPELSKLIVSKHILLQS